MKRLINSLLFCLFCIGLLTAASDGRAAESPLLQRALKGPLREYAEIVFVTRLKYDDPHWYANIGYYCDDENQKAYAGNGQPDNGKLMALDLRTGQTRVILDAHGGSVRDPKVHYDGQTILFSYRPAGTDFYNLYEIESDGHGLRQITHGEFDDYEATYLPNGDIVFVSTRCNRWVNCWMTQVGILYRCGPNGEDPHPISGNAEHDNTPWVLPDGRLLYTRWEYVDRNQVYYHHLWTMNPDGTGQAVYYGNMHPQIVMIDAKPIPGTLEILANFSPGHGRSDHAGYATIVSNRQGPDLESAARQLHRGASIVDPYPLSDEIFLAAQNQKLILMGRDGAIETVYQSKEPGGLHEPRLLSPKPRERLIVDRADRSNPMGQFILADVYHGRNMEGVTRGDIKKLLILESLPKPVNFSGGPDLTSWLGTFTLERVLGTVPVEADGSASFEAPANRQLLFVALDANDLSVKRMQSFAALAPGEVLSCVGCHEHRASTPRNSDRSVLAAMQRPPSVIKAFEGYPDVLDFNRDIQPILDHNCVQCHRFSHRQGGLSLEGVLGPTWSHSYYSLLARKLVADGRNGLGNQPPRSIGSSASRIFEYTDGSHYGAAIPPSEWRTLWLWIESAAPYAGSYAALRNTQDQGREGAVAGQVWGRMTPILKRRCGDCHLIGNPESETGRPIPFAPKTEGNTRGLKRPIAVYERVVLDDDPLTRYSPHVLLNLTRPEQSPLILGPLSYESGGFGSCGVVFDSIDDPDYLALKAILVEAGQKTEALGRYGTSGFKPNAQYIREMKKYGVLPSDFKEDPASINYFDLEQQYWRSLWTY